jgi:hypothetical protein
VLDTTSSDSLASQAGNKTVIGSWYTENVNRHFEGHVSDVMVWQRPLSAPEVLSFQRDRYQFLESGL